MASGLNFGRHRGTLVINIYKVSDQLQYSQNNIQFIEIGLKGLGLSNLSPTKFYWLLQ
jgi:hypothetical protein